MFDRRQDLVKFLAVAEAGKILAAPERLSIGQPAITWAIARIEKRLGGGLFERLPSGVRLTPLGDEADRLFRERFREVLDRRLGCCRRLDCVKRNLDGAAVLLDAEEGGVGRVLSVGVAGIGVSATE